jgi:hypothetical protein
MSELIHFQVKQTRTFFVNIRGFGGGLFLSPGAGMGIGC